MPVYAARQPASTPPRNTPGTASPRLRFARDGRTSALVGHADHGEVEGTYGHAPDRTVIVETVADAETLDPSPDAPRRGNGEELLRFDRVGHTKITE
ncbi:hypothetical protein QR77_31510 [Streptomyces sp. 150FB]|nr:hypothetical protein QR77_31510 [Streptomyces sp. 150FB]